MLIESDTNYNLDSIAYCGHHCSFCFYTDCTGCRSKNPSCSFANLFEDKKCPNVTCCINKGISGCYECNKLSECNHGFFSRKEEQVAKATALFIQKYSLTIYHKTLKKAISCGIKYPDQFNKLKNVQEMILLLEEFI